MDQKPKLSKTHKKILAVMTEGGTVRRSFGVDLVEITPHLGTTSRVREYQLYELEKLRLVQRTVSMDFGDVTWDLVRPNP